MAPAIRVDATLPTPIWSQIEEAVRHLVASGALRPGTRCPRCGTSRASCASTRTPWPRPTSASPRREILETRRGEGTFVAERPPAMPAAERARLLREGATRLAMLAVNLGAARAEAVSALQAAWPEDDPTSKGGKR